MENSLFLIYHLFLIIRLTLGAPNNITTDQSSLLSLKEHISSDPHKFFSNNWSSSSFVCQWRGITCSSRHARVASLDLSNMDLEGTIPPHLGNLSFLVSLDLSSNYFHGTLPIELSRLRRLQVLDLKENNLSGEIPSWFASLHKLRIFLLKNNNFTGFIPPSIFMNLTNLEELRISFNSLQGPIPGQIGNLNSLKLLALGYNQLSGSLPMEIFNMSSLERLSLPGNSLFYLLPDYNEYSCDNLQLFDLSGTKLYGPILSTVSNCSQLQILNLPDTNLGGVIPQEIGKLKALQELYLDSNNLTGKIPREMFNISSLKIIYLSGNIISGKIPREMFNISSLEIINLSHNSIFDSLPDNNVCDSLPRLKDLNMGYNRLYGQIPSNLSGCLQLETLELVENKLHGLIPQDISNLKKLDWLNLGSNNLQGAIPREIGNVTMLRELILDNNHIIGTIPRELGNLYKLQGLWLEYNNITGPIPVDALANCKNLTSLWLSGNPLNGVGSLPDSIGNLSSSIQNFGASECQIKGNIPYSIGNLTNLVDLDLSWNLLSGPIPSSVKFLQKLQALDLRRNKLHGIMIGHLCGLQSLSEIYMQYNEISGPILECLGNLPSLRHLSLGSNNLHGSIPTSLGNLRDLLELNLSTNLLSGPLPHEFGNMKVAITIDLSMNNISGRLPMSLVSLQNLQILHLVHNKIEGSIPKTIGEMVSLESLDLSHNDLSGLIPTSLEKVKYLKYFNVSFNHLSGAIPSGGPFLNFTNESFASNEALCGEKRFHVPPCRLSKPNKRRIPRIVIVLLGIVALVGAIALTFVYLRYRKKNNAENQAGMLPLAGSHERISYYELVQATEGYHEKHFLGKGSFGSVYKGILHDGMIVAVKVFNQQSERVSKSFNVECMVLRELRHRNLVKVISSCSNTDFRALVLEFMVNGSLEQWLYSGHYFLKFKQRLDLMIDVAHALDYLHSGSLTPVVHCDIKPSNILLDQNLIAHVSDFGIAKLLGHEDSMTHTQTLATIGYLAPEYGLEGIVSTKCDVYSYGILLMEVFTRKKPNDAMFEGNLNLRAWVQNALHNSLALVIDANLLKAAEGTNSKEELKCLSSIMEVALNCTKETPGERCRMTEVITAMEKIKVQL